MLTAMLRQAQNGDVTAMQALCQEFGGLIYKAAKQRHLRPLADDALSAAYLGFIEAVHSYNLGGKVPFAGYAKSKVSFAVWNMFKKERYRWQHEISNDIVTEAGISAAAAIADPADSAAIALENIAAAKLIMLLEQLPPRQRAVMKCLLLGEMGITETAKRLNLSPQAVYSLKKTACRRLKKQGFYKWMGNT